MHACVHACVCACLNNNKKPSIEYNIMHFETCVEVVIQASVDQLLSFNLNNIDKIDFNNIKFN